MMAWRLLVSSLTPKQSTGSCREAKDEAREGGDEGGVGRTVDDMCGERRDERGEEDDEEEE